MGIRKRRASHGTYQRHFIGRQCAPNGRRWVKPGHMRAALEKAVITQKDGLKVRALYDFIVKTMEARVPRHKRNGPATMTSGDNQGGSIYLEYAWSNYLKGIILSEAEIMVAANNGTINRWYDSLCSKGEARLPKPEIVIQVTNPKRLRKQRKAAREESERERWARIGREHRAGVAEARAVRDENSRKLLVERALMESLQLMLNGAKGK